MKNTRKRLSFSLGSLVLSLGMAFASLLPSPVMAEDGNAVLQELKGLEIPAVKPGFSKVEQPLEILKRKDLKTIFGKGKNMMALRKSVDFEKQKVLLFRWNGSGKDSLNVKVAPIAKERAKPEVIFDYTPGLTRDLRFHAKAFALSKDAKWKVVRGKDGLAQARISVIPTPIDQLPLAPLPVIPAAAAKEDKPAAPRITIEVKPLQVVPPKPIVQKKVVPNPFPAPPGAPAVAPQKIVPGKAVVRVVPQQGGLIIRADGVRVPVPGKAAVKAKPVIPPNPFLPPRAGVIRGGIKPGVIIKPGIVKGRVPIQNRARSMRIYQQWTGFLPNGTPSIGLPEKGYVSDEETWIELWNAWQPTEKVPEVNFRNEIVLVGALPNKSRVYVRAVTTEAGEVTLTVNGSGQTPSGLSYSFAKVMRTDITSINGVRLPGAPD